MSVLRLYEDSGLTQIVSRNGDYGSPDAEALLDGTNGGSAQKALWAAVEQTVLNGTVDDEQTGLSLAAPRFADTDYPVIVIDSEKMLITAGHGTAGLTVQRGYRGTAPAAHAEGAPVRLAYDCSSITIECADLLGADESAWVAYCADSGGVPTGSWEAPHAIGSLSYVQSAAFHRRVVVPAGTPASYKLDLVHRFICTIEEHQ